MLVSLKKIKESPSREGKKNVSALQKFKNNLLPKGVKGKKHSLSGGVLKQKGHQEQP